MWNNRKQVSWAIAGSVSLHVLLLLLWAFTVKWLPGPPRTVAPPPIHLQMVKSDPTPPPAVPLPTPTPHMIPFVDTSSREASATPSVTPKFQSDRDTQAASLLPVTGDQPLPSQRGKIAPGLAFDTTVYTPGDTGAASAASEPPPARKASTPIPAPPHESKPMRTPVPDSEFGLAEATPTPDDAEPAFDPAFRAPASSPPRPTVAARAANRSNALGFQMTEEASGVNGSVERRGAANVDSMATPVGRYQMAVIHVIKAKWTNYFYAHSDMFPSGMVTIHFEVNRSGHVVNPRVLYNSSNEALAAMSLQMIADAPISPMPVETISDLKARELTIDLTFIAE